MSADPRAKKVERHAWSIHFDQANFYLDELISGWIELVVQDVYMASTIKINLMQFVTVTVSDKNKKVGTPLLPEPMNLLQDLPRTQFCMGRHKIRFSIRPTFASSSASPSSDSSRTASPKRETVDIGVKDAERMLPTTHWSHQEDASVYSGTARSASVSVQYLLEVHSLRAVSGSVETLVASAEVPVRQRTTTFHAPAFSGSYAPVAARATDLITLKAKLNQKIYCHGDTMQLNTSISSSNFEIKKVVFTLLNSAMIRDNPSDAVMPALHTSILASTEINTPIEAGKTVDKTLQLSIPDSALPRFSAVLTQPHAKIRTEVVLRITIVVEGYSDHIFQSTISIVSAPKPSSIAELALNTEINSGIVQDATESPTTASKVVLWVDDRQAARCAHCTGLFSFLHRKHHCRGCGLIVCADHSKKLSAPKLFGLKPRLVCNACQPLIATDELVSNGGVPPTDAGEDSGLPVVHIHESTFSEHVQSIQQEIDLHSSLKLSTGVSQPASIELKPETETLSADEKEPVLEAIATAEVVNPPNVEVSEQEA